MSLSLRISLGRWVGLLTLMVSLAAAGCGSRSTGTVSGKVYYKGAPLKGGNVTFMTATKESFRGEIQEDGSYKVVKVPPGEVLIGVETESLKPPNAMILKNKPPADAQGSKSPDFAARAKRYVAIPKRYSDAEKSGLKETVKSGAQEHDIKLE